MRYPMPPSCVSVRKSVKTFSTCLILIVFSLCLYPPLKALAAGDDLINATTVATFPFSETVDNTGYTIETSEVGSSIYSFWYTVTPATDSALRVAAVNDTVNPRVSLFVGTTHPLSYPDDNNGDADSDLDNIGQYSENFVWGVTAGTTYYIRIASATAGPIQVMIDNPALTTTVPDNLADATEITDILNEYLDMANATLETSENDCGGIDRSIWYVVTPAADAVLAVLEDGEQDDHALGLYTGSSFPQTEEYCSDSDNRGGDSEGYVKELTGGMTYYIKVGSRNLDVDPSVLNVRIAVMPSAAFSNDNLANAKTVDSDAFTEAIDNTGSTIETGETGGTGDDYSFWYTLTPDRDSTVTITVAALTQLVDPTVGIYTGSSHPLTEVAYQDFNNLFSSDQNSYGGGEEIMANLSANTTYHVRVASKTEGTVGVAISGLDVDDEPSDPIDPPNPIDPSDPENSSGSSSLSLCFIATLMD